MKNLSFRFVLAPCSLASAWLFAATGPQVQAEASHSGDMRPATNSVPAVRVEHGRIVIDSPFDLEIGSTKYAKTFGNLIRTSASAVYDPRMRKTTTNFYHHAEAHLATPYFGCDKVWLNFKGEEKMLESCNLSIGRWASGTGRMMSYSECRETVDKIAVDMGKRLDILMQCTSDHTEEESRAQVEKAGEEVQRIDAEENKRTKRKGRSVFATSFIMFNGEKKIKDGFVDYRVSGLFSSRKNYSISIDYSRHREFPLASYRPGDKIPVHTNETYSAMGRLMPTTEQQKKAHDEARRLRDTVNRLFGMDLDAAAGTNAPHSAMSGSNVPAKSAKNKTDVNDEWVPLDSPFEGMTERKVDKFAHLRTSQFGMLTLRRPYDGDVSEAELKAQAQRFLDRLEKEYGEKISEDTAADGAVNISKMYGDRVPTFGDALAMFGHDRTRYFAGKVGDLSVEIIYAVPRYAKKGNRFVITCKGAVVVNIIQSPTLGLAGRRR